MKERITVTLEKDLLAWLDQGVNDHIFANRSHGFEFLIAEKIREEKMGKIVKNDW
ncbi:hypothetical protein J4227_05945 [Candidatus Woesearchaeota archaeon]|nr:hypothetical protein [Candidatus Woesearchaeota archaeon]